MNEMICLNSKLENLKQKTRNIYNIVLMSQRWFYSNKTLFW